MGTINRILGGIELKVNKVIVDKATTFVDGDEGHTYYIFDVTLKYYIVGEMQIEINDSEENLLRNLGINSLVLDAEQGNYLGEEIYIDPYSFYLATSNGTVSSRPSGHIINGFEGVYLSPDQTASGEISFKVQNDTEILALYYYYHGNKYYAQEIPKSSAWVSYLDFYPGLRTNVGTFVKIKNPSSGFYRSGDIATVEIFVKNTDNLHLLSLTIKSIEVPSPFTIVSVSPKLPIKLYYREWVNLSLNIKVPEESYTGKFVITVVCD